MGNGESETHFPNEPGAPGLLSTIRRAASFEVLIACGIAFVGISVVSAASPVLGNIQDDFLIPTALVGLIGSSFGLARLLVDLPAGNLAGRMDVRLLAGAGLLIVGVGSAAGTLAGSYPILLVARVLMGIGQSVTSIANLTWITSVSAPEVRTTVMAMYQTAIVTGLSFYPFMSGVLAEGFGWRAAFAVCSVSALVGLGLAGLALTRGRRITPETVAPQGGNQGLRGLTQLPRAQLLGLVGVYACIFLLMFNSVGFLGTAIPLYGHDVLALSPAAIGTGLAIASLIGLAVTIPGGAWADRFGPMRILLPGLGGIVAGSIAFLFVRNTIAFVIAAAIVGLYSLASSVPSAILAHMVPARQRGPAVGVYRLAGDVGVLSGPLMLSWIIDVAGHQAAILVAAAVAAAVLFSAWRLIGPCVADDMC